MSVVSVIFFRSKASSRIVSKYKKTAVELATSSQGQGQVTWNSYSEAARRHVFYHFPKDEVNSRWSNAGRLADPRKTPSFYPWPIVWASGKVPTSYELKYSQEERSGKKDALAGQIL